MNEERKYEVIKRLIDSNGNKERAAVALGCTVRHINRLINGYKAKGKEYFIHGNRGRRPVHAMDEKTKQLIIDLYKTKFGDSNFTHFSELLLKPYEIIASPDRRTVFEYKQKKSTSIEEDTFTQFGYACKQLGIEIQATSVAQAKGRVERLFQTLQSRLPVEMRLAGITTIEQANEFLNSYIKEFNSQFALPLDNTKSVFETQPSAEKINLILAVISQRKVDNGSCIKYKNNYYIPVSNSGIAVHYHKGTSGLIIKAFNEQLYISIKDNVYSLELIPNHVPTSKNFDFISLPKKPRKKYIPPMSHPWKQDSFEEYCKKQAHRMENVALSV
ncbi:helix-turn-helix domain-containing protein [Hathewaya proteolytica]